MVGGSETADETLLVAWREGNARAGELLFERYFERVARFYRVRLGADIEDLVQATFEALAARKVAVRDGTFRAYLFAICRNRLFEHLRQRYRLPIEHERLSELSLADMGTSPSEWLARHQRAQQLLAAMHALPLDQRLILELAYWEDMSGEEIAEVLGISHNAVRLRLTRARAELRALLGAAALEEDHAVASFVAAKSEV